MGADPDRKTIKIPNFIGWLVAAISEIVSLFTGKPALFSMYNFRYLSTTQWYSCEKVRNLCFGGSSVFLTMHFVRPREC
jgi:hypothetical protein